MKSMAKIGLDECERLANKLIDVLKTSDYQAGIGATMLLVAQIIHPKHGTMALEDFMDGVMVMNKLVDGEDLPAVGSAFTKPRDGSLQ